MLDDRGHKVNHKRIRRLSRKMGIEAVYPKPKLTKPSLKHKKYAIRPELLDIGMKKTKIERYSHNFEALKSKLSYTPCICLNVLLQPSTLFREEP